MALNVLLSQHQFTLYAVGFLVGAAPAIYVAILTAIVHAKATKKTEDRLAYMRAYNEILHTRMYRPEGRMPRDLIHEARRRCFEMGGDLSVANDMRLAIHSVWEDAEEFSLRWQWFTLRKLSSSRTDCRSTGEDRPRSSAIKKLHGSR